MITENDKRLGKRIKQLRRRGKLTQEQLAEEVKVTPKYIQYIESAKRIPSLKTLYRIAKALNIKTKELFPF
jgi:transcriptional regulator with XRE-family HTH domain